MDQKEYISEQIKNLDKAMHLAEKARRTTLSLQDFFFPAQSAAERTEEDDFSMDTFKYFDANSALRQLEKLQLQLGDLKAKLIEIKIANDRLLYEGGYLACIDQSIARIFLKNTLCKLKAQDENTPAIIEDSVQELNALKKELTALMEA